MLQVAAILSGTWAWFALNTYCPIAYGLLEQSMAGGLILVSGRESIHGSRLLYFPTHPWDSATVSIWSWMSETVRWKWKWKHPIETMTHPMRPTKYMKSDLPCGCSWELKTDPNIMYQSVNFNWLTRWFIYDCILDWDFTLR